jgi:hypothetical protein
VQDCAYHPLVQLQLAAVARQAKQVKARGSRGQREAHIIRNPGDGQPRRTLEWAVDVLQQGPEPADQLAV